MKWNLESEGGKILFPGEIPGAWDGVWDAVCEALELDELDVAETVR